MFVCVGPVQESLNADESLPRTGVSSLTAPLLMAVAVRAKASKPSSVKRTGSAPLSKALVSSQSCWSDVLWDSAATLAMTFRRGDLGPTSQPTLFDEEGSARLSTNAK